MPNYGAFRFTRVAGPDARRARYLFADPGRLDQPGRFREQRPCRSGSRCRSRTGADYAKGATYGEEIRAELARERSRPCWCSTANSRPSPSTRCSSSPNAASPGTTPAARTSSSCSACSRRSRRRSASRSCSARRARAFKPARINAQFAYIGGGFGGRDHTPFPLYVALAAMFFPGRPVRLAHDRYQQFQGGIKRHAFKMRTRIGVDRASGKMTRVRRRPRARRRRPRQLFGQRRDGRRHRARSASTTFPRSTSPRSRVHSRGVTAGSMRGYGTLQTMTALEVLVDEAAAALPLDPIEFRRRNALKVGGRTMTGNPYTVSVRTPEILDKLENASDLARARRGEGARQQGGIARRHRRRLRHQGLRHRRGLLARARSRSTREGRITIHGDHVEMGNGIGTALANRVAVHLGGVADEVTRARRSTSSTRSALVTSGDPYTMTQATQDAAATQSALGAGDQLGDQRLDRRACRDAGGGRGRARRVPLRPVAGGARTVGHRADRSASRSSGTRRSGRTGSSSCRACRRCRCRRSPRKAHARNGVTGAMAHAFSRWAWSQATFPIARRRNGPPTSTRWRCATASGEFARLDRTQRGVSAHRLQPHRHRLHLAVRHAGPRRDRARDRRAADRQGLQRPRMRPGAGAGGGASGRRRAASPWASAMRCSRRCRPSRTGPATGSGTSATISSRAAPTCRCTTSRSRCCRRSRRRSRRRAWRRS